MLFGMTCSGDSTQVECSKARDGRGSRGGSLGGCGGSTGSGPGSRCHPPPLRRLSRRSRHRYHVCDC